MGSAAADLLSRLRGLAAKATPAPWKMVNGGVRTDASCVWHVQGRAGDLAVRDRWNDADFIVALRNAWPSLLARIEAGERLAEACKRFTGKLSPNIRDALGAFYDAQKEGEAMSDDTIPIGNHPLSRLSRVLRDAVSALTWEELFQVVDATPTDNNCNYLTLAIHGGAKAAVDAEYMTRRLRGAFGPHGPLVAVMQPDAKEEPHA